MKKPWFVKNIVGQESSTVWLENGLMVSVQSIYLWAWQIFGDLVWLDGWNKFDFISWYFIYWLHLHIEENKYNQRKCDEINHGIDAINPIIDDTDVDDLDKVALNFFSIWFAHKPKSVKPTICQKSKHQHYCLWSQVIGSLALIIQEADHIQWAINDNCNKHQKH